MIAIKNGKIITPSKILDGKIIIIDGGVIRDITNSVDEAAFERVIDAHGRYVAPGIIDTHSDKIEQLVQPRPTASMDLELALKECERELMLSGITTMYHSLSLFKDEFFGSSHVRSRKNLLRLAELIHNTRDRFHLIRHRFHLRLEIDNIEAYDMVRDMIDGGMVHLLSFMDHTPGQGQYKNLEIYQKTISKYKGKEMRELGFDGVLEYHKNKDTLSLKQLKELTSLAKSKGIAVASHDDDTAEKLKLNRFIGVTVSEFPITLDTAKKAKEMGFLTVAGAPNILLGGSHSGNMSAAEAISESCADILVSDYYPPAMLHGVFAMREKYGMDLCDMMNLVTLNPARAMNIDKDYGSVETGKKADLIIIDASDGYPVVTHSIVGGKQVSRIEYRRDNT